MIMMIIAIIITITIVIIMICLSIITLIITMNILIIIMIAIIAMVPLGILWVASHDFSSQDFRRRAKAGTKGMFFQTPVRLPHSPRRSRGDCASTHTY